MNLQRLKMWEEALVDAERRGRMFNFTTFITAAPKATSPCGFTACLAGDLALYKPAQDLGLGVSIGGEHGVGGHGAITWNGRFSGSGDAISAFLETTRGEEAFWLSDTINPCASRAGYGKTWSEVTRADGLARIRAKIAEMEAATAV